MSPRAVLVPALLAGLAATALGRGAPGHQPTTFGAVDPVFSRDVGFYVFTLPAVSAVLALSLRLALVTLLLLLIVYALRADIIVRARAVRVEPSAGIHLAIVLATLLFVSAAAAVDRGQREPALLDHRPAGRRQLHRPARHAAGPAPLGARGRAWPRPPRGSGRAAPAPPALRALRRRAGTPSWPCSAAGSTRR